MSDPQLPGPLLDPAEQVENLVQRTHRLVLESMESLFKKQMEPFLDHARQTILESIRAVFQTHADSLIGRLQSVALDTLEAMLKRQIEPFVERTRQLVLGGMENASVVKKSTDLIVQGVKQFLTETITEAVQVHLPAATRRASKRLIDTALVATLGCLAIIFLLIGLLEGLQALGLAKYAAFPATGAIATLAAVLFHQFRRP